MQETNNTHQTVVLSFGEEGFGSSSFSTFSNPKLSRRSHLRHDFSFGFSPLANSDTNTPFSPPQPDSTAAGFSFPLLPSFSFFTPPPPNHQETILSLSSDNTKENAIQRDSSFGELLDKEAKGIAATSRATGLRSKRNRTIGLGEIEQLDLMVSESVIRWASCAHLPSAPSLRSSLVC